MDKVILLVFLILAIACKHHERYQKENYQLLFYYNPWTEIDLNTKVVKVKFDQLDYKDTLKISKKDLEIVYESFYKNEINKIRKEVSIYNDKIKISPTSEFRIKVIRHSKLQSEIIIDDNYQNSSSSTLNQKYRIVCFRNDVLRILENNKQINKAVKILLDYHKNQHVLIL